MYKNKGVQQVQKVQRAVQTSILVTEIGHVFCCVLPTLFSVCTFLVTLGILSATPVFMTSVHDVIHGWEVPIIIMSAVMLAIGWGIHRYSVAVDCHSTGCHHEPCKPVKKRTSNVLRIATVLFLVNAGIYFALHNTLVDTGILVAGARDHAH